jgi:predicted DNA-binding transcriptional regulator YafY
MLPSRWKLSNVACRTVQSLSNPGRAVATSNMFGINRLHTPSGTPSMSADYSRVHRLLHMITLMQQGAAGRAPSLAEGFGVVERTIYRDLEILTDLGVPHYFDEVTGGYRIRKDYFLPPIQLTAAETLALLSLTRTVANEEPLQLLGPAATAMHKIAGQLPDRVMQEVGNLHEHIHFHLPANGPAIEAVQDVFGVVQQAIAQRCALRCSYDAVQSDEGDQHEAFLLRPYALSFDNRAWYVVGHHGTRDAIRRLKLCRFTSLQPTTESYTIPADFSVTAFRGNAWRMIRGGTQHHVVIDFTPTVADTVSETNWHATQHIDEHPDGSLTFTCDVDGLDEIVWWILGYGPHARVREPVELVNRVADLVREMAERYEEKLSGT